MTPTGEVCLLKPRDECELSRRLDDFENGLANLAKATNRRLDRIAADVRLLHVKLDRLLELVV